MLNEVINVKYIPITYIVCALIILMVCAAFLYSDAAAFDSIPKVINCSVGRNKEKYKHNKGHDDCDYLQSLTHTAPPEVLL